MVRSRVRIGWSIHHLANWNRCHCSLPELKRHLGKPHGQSRMSEHRLPTPARTNHALSLLAPLLNWIKTNSTTRAGYCWWSPLVQQKACQLIPSSKATDEQGNQHEHTRTDWQPLPLRRRGSYRSESCTDRGDWWAQQETKIFPQKKKRN